MMDSFEQNFAHDKQKALETATQRRYGNSSRELCKRKQG